METEFLKLVLEALLMVSKEPLSLEAMQKVFLDQDVPSKAQCLQALASLETDYLSRAIELKQVGSGYRLQTRETVQPWVAKLFTEKPGKYSQALLETLAIIAYKQPVTRAEIEKIRGVAVSSPMIKTLLEREWIKVVAYRDVPGKPAVYATTKQFLDYFNLRALDELPLVAIELREL